MADPLNPKLSDGEFVARMLRLYPNLTREEILEEGRAYGFDLMVPESGPSSPGEENSESK